MRSTFVRVLSIAALLLLVPLAAHGQASADWQQRVAYEMDITLHADRHQMDGFQRLTYTNNSPDVLRHVFFHLYFNAFRPNSMMAERNRHLPDPDSRVVPRIFELGPDEVGYHDIQSLTQNGRQAPFEIHDTVMKVTLPEPIMPGESAVFEMRFTSQVPLQTRRSGRDSRGGGIDFSMAQWYPKMAAYDSRGWHADPYVGREFYAPYGSFDVRLTLPAEYIVGATGVLQNPEEVGHGYADEPGTDGHAPGDSLTWHFMAENVHDFAWGADPEYIHDRFDVDGTTVHLLYKPDVAENWRPLQRAMPPLIRYFNARFGTYPWPQFTVIEGGDGGMEYPMMTFVSGYSRPSYTRPRSAMSVLGTTIHEFAHMWYYGVLGSNEADYAWMDEGFVSFAAEEASAALFQRPPNHVRSTLNVLTLQHWDLYERLNTPADWYETNEAYGVAAYSAGEMLVHMLGYVMGEQVRDEWLLEYFDRYTFRHPDPWDIEQSAEAVSGLRLDWYFEQFANTTRTLDYAIDDLTSRDTAGTWLTTITLERKDEVVMPVDLLLTLEDGTAQGVTIPLGIMQGHKPVPENWIVAEPWLWTFPRYTLTLELPQRVVAATIDPRLYTPDRNRLNNHARVPVQARFLQPPRQSWVAYDIGYRPLAQYAHDFGFGAGLQARGTYVFDQYRLQAMLKLWPQVLFSGSDEPELPAPDAEGAFHDGIDYALSFEHPFRALGPLASISLSAQKHLGFMENRATLTKPLGRWAALGADAEKTLSFSLIHQLSPTDRVFSVIYEDLYMLNPFRRAHMASARAAFRVEDGLDILDLAVELGSSLKDARTASRLTLYASKGADLGELTGRAQFKAGLGSDNLAPHKLFRLGAASYEDRWRNPAFRTIAAAFENPLEEAHLAALQEPGPVAYLLRESAFELPPLGRNVLAGSLSLTTGALSRNVWLQPLRLSAFSGIGTVWNTAEEFDDAILADAGLGLSYNVGAVQPLNRWIAQSDVLSTLHLVARFPLWVSDPDWLGADEEAFGFRWLIGVQVGELGD